MVNSDFTGTFEGVGGLHLYFQGWYPAGRSPRAVVVQVHGLGGHGSVYLPLVRGLIRAGYTVYAIDLRGHGHSAGQRGYINRWNEFRTDLARFLTVIRSREPDAVLFLLGHSMGATIALDFLLHEPDGVQGAIVSSPALGEVKASPVRIALGQLVSRMWPRFSLETGFNLSMGSRDPAVVEACQLDTLRHYRATARLVTEYYDTIAWIHAHSIEWKLPLLVLIAGDDCVVEPAAGLRFFQQVISPDKTLREYPDAYHDLFNDYDAPKAIADIEGWLNNHVGVGD